MSPKTKNTAKGAVGGKGGAAGAMGIAIALEMVAQQYLPHPLPPGLAAAIVAGLAFVVGAVPSLMRHWGWERTAMLAESYIEDYEGQPDPPLPEEVEQLVSAWERREREMVAAPDTGEDALGDSDK